MMLPLSLGNVWAYCVQMAVLTLVGTTLVALLRVRMPSARLACWRALSAGCLALPLLQPWVDPPGRVTAAVASIAEGAMPVANASNQAAWWLGLGWAQLLLAVWVLGTVAWLVRLIVGLLGLRALRCAGTPASLSPAVAEIEGLVGASADMRWVQELSQPVTFGVRRPVVLLPAALHGMSTDVQRAVVAHELIHVTRRDWVWVVAEEAVRALLWFHPAIWWLLARVQLAREQVVDAEAVRLLGARRPYMEALLACADRTSFVPVPAFARRRELFQRLTQLSREAEMTRARLLCSFAVLALGVIVAGRYTVAAFPLHAPPPVVDIVHAPSIATPQGLRKIVHVDPQYPPDVPLDEVRGVVTLNITVDERGSVVDAQVVSTKVDGPSPSAGGSDVTGDAAKAIRAAALQWKYEPLGQPMATLVLVPFGKWGSPAAEGRRFRGNVEMVRKDGERFGGDEAYLSDADEVILRQDNNLTVIPDVARIKGDVISSHKPLRVGGAIKQPRKIRNVDPIYPAEAQAARVQGIVILETTIGTDGTVTHARVVKSIPMLDQAALDAVMLWEYTPTMLNGVAVPVLVTVTVNFTLR